MADRGKSSVPSAAVGFRVHSGWAALVAISGPLGASLVIDRQRVQIVNPDDRSSVQPYHAAAELSLGDAAAFISRCSATSTALAIQALGTVIGHLRGNGHNVVGCGVILSSGRPTNDLAATLASHALIHTAEGNFFREALIRAAGHFGLSVTAVKERELSERAAGAFGVTEAELQRRIKEWGRSLGPPWTQDQKYAALAACLALAAHTSASQPA